MGNRAVVKFENEDEKHGVYLHWNGGPDSVLAFLKVMEERKWMRMDYASARFIGVVVEFFDSSGSDSGLSVGVCEDPDAWAEGCDQGMYIIKTAHTHFVVEHNGKQITEKSLDSSEMDSYLAIINRLVTGRLQRKLDQQKRQSEF